METTDDDNSVIDEGVIDDDTLDEVVEIEKLYIETEGETITSIEQLLEIMIPRGVGYFEKTTYYDEECTKRQCGAYRRSFDDLYILFKTYFPTITKKEALLAMGWHDLHFYFCEEINKIVFHRALYHPATLSYFEKYKPLFGGEFKYKKGTHTTYDFIEILQED